MKDESRFILWRLLRRLNICRYWPQAVAADSGMALLMTLAAISFLVAVTVGLATSVNLQMQAARSLQISTRLDATLASGLALARAALYADQQQQQYDTLLDGWNNLDKEKLKKLAGDIDVDIHVGDMSGRIQINRLVLTKEDKKKGGPGLGRRAGGRNGGNGRQTNVEKLQRRLWLRFLLSGKFAVDGQEEAVALVDTLSDWLDEDDNERDHGAENGYYQSLPVPYRCRNGRLRYPEELLLVKGFTRKIVYGDKEHEGIIDYLTIYGQDGKININTAPAVVLQALTAGLDEEMVASLISFRQEKDNLIALKNPQWYRHAPDFPGDIILDAGLVTTKSSFFSVSITAGDNGWLRTGKGMLYRDPKTRQQDLLSWQVE